VNPRGIKGTTQKKRGEQRKKEGKDTNGERTKCVSQQRALFPSGAQQKNDWTGRTTQQQRKHKGPQGTQEARKRRTCPVRGHLSRFVLRVSKIFEAELFNSCPCRLPRTRHLRLHLPGPYPRGLPLRCSHSLRHSEPWASSTWPPTCPPFSTPAGLCSFD
jgi:hypothetical protein